MSNLENKKEEDKFVCEFCKKCFTTSYNLKNHQKTAKFCLDIQNKPVEESYKCEYCNKGFNLKTVYNSHIGICKDKKAVEDEKLLTRVKELEKELKQKDILLAKLKTKVSSKDEIIKKLEKTNKELLKRPTTINNNNNNDNRQQNQYNIQFNQLFEKLPILNEANVNNRINELSNEENVNKYNFNNFYIESLEKIVYQLKDLSICTDSSRKMVVIKDESEKSVRMNAEEFLSKCFDYGSESITNHVIFTDKILNNIIDNDDSNNPRITSEMLDNFNDDRDNFLGRIRNNKANFFLTNDQTDNKIESTIVTKCVKQLEKCSK
jgi:hypothetical protein